MKVLGISLMHDSSASLIVDGNILACAEEERFSRIKHDDSFPFKSIDFCLREGQIKIKEIDKVMISWQPWKGITHNAIVLLRDGLRSGTLFDARFSRKRSYFDVMKDMWSIYNVGTTIQKHYGYRPKVTFVDHHLSHAASAYYASRFREAAILTMDAIGEKTTTTLSQGKNGKIKTLSEIYFPHSTGHLYTLFTKLLGFKAHSDEGKIMALASYGDPSVFRNKFQRLYKLTNEGFTINSRILTYQLCLRGRYTKELRRMFGMPRKPHSEIQKVHQDIAAGLQEALETIGIHLANILWKKTKNPNLCLAGGVCLNSVMNHKILEKTPFEKVFIQPAAGDSGGSLGAAMLGSGSIKRFESAYLGPEFSNNQIEMSLKKKKINYRKTQAISKKAAVEISKGRIVGWFQGRMEFGPRALGNRSILADPRNKNMKDIVNARVKFRESFRPFAPSVMAEEYDRYFDVSQEVPYMLLVSNVKKNKRKIIPSVTHVDGSARLQTVSKEQNEGFWNLLKQFKVLTGIPIVLNTSFNIKGEPIVCSPEDAINCFLKTNIDVLCIGNYIVDKKWQK